MDGQWTYTSVSTRIIFFQKKVILQCIYFLYVTFLAGRVCKRTSGGTWYRNANRATSGGASGIQHTMD